MIFGNPLSCQSFEICLLKKISSNQKNDHMTAVSNEWFSDINKIKMYEHY